jgi:long-chain acyl-CoA synthetase
MDKRWLKQYPAGAPTEVKLDVYPSLVALMEDSFQRHRTLPAYKFMGKALTFEAVDESSRALAAYLQGLGLGRGDRVALMMPNVPQYPVAMAAVLRAGYVVVNVNPLYTARELEHQLKDSGAKAIILLENMATTVQQVLAAVPTRKVILTGLGDLLGFPKAWWVNVVLRRIQKQVPAYEWPGAVRFNEALAQGRRMSFTPAPIGPHDIALLQYTEGTTGVSKGAVLLHRNLVANVLQSEAWYQAELKQVPSGEQIHTVCALPMHHHFGFNTNWMLGLRMGGCNILIANPSDLPAVFKALEGERFHSFLAVNTLFNALANSGSFDTVDWSSLQVSVASGMPVQSATATRWLEQTGCPIVGGYGLAETSSVAACAVVDALPHNGTIGMPLPHTDLKLLDEDGQDVTKGQTGEIAIRGPQVMAGYWQRPEETAKVMTPEGFFRTGDMGVMDELGFFKLVGRKNDLILVSGFNVYPAEVEDVVNGIPGVLECAAVGVPDEPVGEALKVVVVRKEPNVSEAEIRARCEAELTGYKRPKFVEFRAELPKTPVGKVLRRELRDKPLA